MRVLGEDYIATASALSSLNTTWATVVGFAVTPYGMGSNTLSDLSRSYAEYRFNKLMVCFVPAVGTSANGQFALYRKSQRADPHLDPNGSNFFAYVLNQRSGVIGPVWQPCSFETDNSRDWRSTVPLEAIDINDDADGEVFLATNNNVASGSSPPIGILKIMYDLQFRGFRRNPRAALIPVANQIYQNISLGASGAAVTLGGSLSGISIIGNDQTGNPSSAPSGLAQGDVFKFVVDSNRSSYGAANVNTLIAELLLGGNRVVNISNGFTCWAVYGGTSFALYPTLAAAMALSQTYVWGLTSASLTFNLVGMISLVGNVLATANSDI